MKFTEDNLVKLENLAKLNLIDNEKERCLEAFIQAINLANTLEEVSTEGIEPLVSPLNLINVMRDDVVLPSLDREKVMSLAMEKEDGCYKVPRIL